MALLSLSTGLQTTVYEKKKWAEFENEWAVVEEYSSFLTSEVPGCCRSYWSQTLKARIQSYYSVFPCGKSSWYLCNSILLKVTGISWLRVFSSVGLFFSKLSKLKKILFMEVLLNCYGSL